MSVLKVRLSSATATTFADSDPGVSFRDEADKFKCQQINGKECMTEWEGHREVYILTMTKSNRRFMHIIYIRKCTHSVHFHTFNPSGQLFQLFCTHPNL